jgi:phage terminase large subunit-like protein
MPQLYSAETVRKAQAELELRARAEREELQSRYDWFGDACPCGLPLGKCRTHQRARPSQRPPGSYLSADTRSDWRIWLIDAGRGFGKSRTAAEFITSEVMSGRVRWVALINATVKDVRDVQIKHPESGLEVVAPPWFKPLYEPSKAQVTWPNGAYATIYSTEEPGALRGPAFGLAWCIAEGTPVMTESGEVPIEHVRAGDRVWTRDGLRTVTAAGPTARQAAVFKVTTSCGLTLRLTGNHRIWLENKGWTPCLNVCPGDKILAWKHTTIASSRVRRHGSSGAASAGIATVAATTRTAPGRSCTRRFGNGATAIVSRTVMSSTTSTRTSRTTCPRTSSYSLKGSTRGSISPRDRRAIPGSMPRRARRPASGLLGSGRSVRLGMSCVSAAGNSTSRSGCGPNTARGPVRRVTRVASVEPDGRADVYDLKVSGSPEFIAGRILVHNCDELAKWEVNQQETWDMLQFCLRSITEPRPRVVVTTTPQPTDTFKSILADPRTVKTGGTMWENEDNLDPDFVRYMEDRYQGTRLGRQELEAILDVEMPGALWQRSMIDPHRLPPGLPAGVGMVKVVVAIDPSAGSHDPERAAETGITVNALGSDGHGYLLADLSLKGPPTAWGKVALKAYRAWRADKVIAEKNNGGDMVEHVIKTIEAEPDIHPAGRDVPFQLVWASRGKQTRAEPVANLYEQGKIHHCGRFDDLENQLCSWIPDGKRKSPDRLDANVWGFSEVMPGIGDSIPGHPVSNAPPAGAAPSAGRLVVPGRRGFGLGFGGGRRAPGAF